MVQGSDDARDIESQSTPSTAVPFHREIARAAAREFLGENVSLELLGHGQSASYRVDAPSGRYLLRVHVPLAPPTRPEFFAPRAIESECMWLRALGDETELVVQRPIAGPSGQYVLSVPHDGAPVACTLLTWVDGEHIEGKRTPQQAAALGELLAALREHAQGWETPPGFERPTHDRASWHSALAHFDDLIGAGIASTSDRDLLARAVGVADEELTPLMLRTERVGLLHGDLHGDNYVFHRGSPRPIDFGLSGFGPWLWDVAESLTHVGPARRRDLVDAYALRWPLEAGDIRRLEGYFLMSLVEVLGFNAPDPGEHEFLSRAVPAWAPFYRRYVDGAPFLFEL